MSDYNQQLVDEKVKSSTELFYENMSDMINKEDITSMKQRQSDT